jgi:hypothetical protein
VSMKDLDPAFHGAGQKEYPFSHAFLYYVLFSWHDISNIFISTRRVMRSYDDFLSLSKFG